MFIPLQSGLEIALISKLEESKCTAPIKMIFHFGVIAVTCINTHTHTHKHTHNMRSWCNDYRRRK